MGKVLVFRVPLERYVYAHVYTYTGAPATYPTCAIKVVYNVIRVRFVHVLIGTDNFHDFPNLPLLYLIALRITTSSIYMNIE